MRIIGGSFGGRKLTALGKGDAAAHLRPTSDRVRESLFNVLEGGRYGDPVAGAVVLDLFAGTGALGLEALSRGAAQVCFVENGRKSLTLLKQNIELCGAQTNTKVISRDARRLGAPLVQAKLVFLDPPYGKSLGDAALREAHSAGWIGPDALIVWEEGSKITPPAEFEILETRSFGGTTISFLRQKNALH